jgi:hypothetical protein
MEAILIRHHRPRLNINLLPRLPKVAGIAAGQFRAMNEALNTLTTEEAAQALGVTPSRVRQMIRAGQL